MPRQSMYPFLRLGLASARSSIAPRLALGAVHLSRHRCWPWDLDPWVELNNGRALTLYDLGRLPLARLSGLTAALRAEGWGITVAGASVRYRRRVRAFDLSEMRSRLVGRDARFLYIHQAMAVRGEAASAVLIRSAVTGPDGIVDTDRVLSAMGAPGWRPPLPVWIAAWADAEATRPWPPEV
jgi:acyl-CoA thioesterase FadM